MRLAVDQDFLRAIFISEQAKALEVWYRVSVIPILLCQVRLTKPLTIRRSVAIGLSHCRLAFLTCVLTPTHPLAWLGSDLARVH
jgi:hypothetical protein